MQAIANSHTDFGLLQIDPDKLRKLLGQQLLYQGIPHRIIDIIDEGPALVLQDVVTRKTIQSNQHGDASRWVPHTVTVAVLNVRQDGLNPTVPALADLLKK